MKFQSENLVAMVELVRGCENTGCPSYGRNCQEDAIEFMSLDTLNGLAKILLGVTEHFEDVQIYPYGRGDTLLHPNLTAMLIRCREWFPDASISLSIDSMREIPEDDLWLVPLNGISISHKLPEIPGSNWISRAYNWSNAYSLTEVKHRLIVKHITKALIEEIASIEKDFTSITIAPFHEVPFGDPEPEYLQREQLFIEYGVQYSSVEKNVKFERVMFDVNGDLRTCILAPAYSQNIVEHLTGDKPCNICKMGSNDATFKDGKLTISAMPIGCVSCNSCRHES